MLYGMSTVFVFLTLLIFLLKLLELFVRQFPEQAAAATPSRMPGGSGGTGTSGQAGRGSGTASGSVDPAHRLAIEKAIKTHLKS